MNNTSEESLLWGKIAINNMKSALILFKNNQKSSVIIMLQQFADKICKSLLSLFGVSAYGMYYPSSDLEDLYDSLEDELDNDSYRTLVRLVELSKTIENEEERPQFGVLHSSKFIIPDEYYSESDVRLFMEDAIKIAKLFNRFIESYIGTDSKFSDITSALSDLITEYDLYIASNPL